MAQITQITSFVRGDTPLFTFTILQNGVAMDLTGYSASITITANAAPSSLSDAIIAKQPMTISGNTVSYQLTATISKTLTVGTTYYGDIELTKSPADTNTFTPVRFQFTVLQDYGV